MQSSPLLSDITTACSRSACPAHIPKPVPCTECLVLRPTSTLRSPPVRPRIKAARTTTPVAQPLQIRTDGRNPATKANRSSLTLSSTNEQHRHSRTPHRQTSTSSLSSLSSLHSHIQTWLRIAVEQHPSNHRVPPINNLLRHSYNAKSRTNTHLNPPTTRHKQRPQTSPTLRARATTTARTAHRHLSSAPKATPRNHPNLPRRRYTTARRPSSSKRRSHRPPNQQPRGKTLRTREKTHRRKAKPHRSNSSNRSSLPNNSSGSNHSSNSNSKATGTQQPPTQWAATAPKASPRRRKQRPWRRKQTSR